MDRGSRLIKADIKKYAVNGMCFNVGGWKAVLRFDPAYYNSSLILNYISTIYSLSVTTIYRFISGEGGYGDLSIRCLYNMQE